MDCIDGSVIVANINGSGGGGGSTTLDGLTDTSIPTPADGEILTYDNASGKWVASVAGGLVASDFTSVSAQAVSTSTAGAGTWSSKVFATCPASHSLVSWALTDNRQWHAGGAQHHYCNTGKEDSTRAFVQILDESNNGNIACGVTAYCLSDSAAGGGGGGGPETDPQVGAVTLNQWCRGDGSAVACDQPAPTGDDLGDHTATQNINMSGFWLSNDGGNEGVFVDTAGNVGIGTGAPRTTLSVLNSDESTTLTNFTQGLSSAGVNIITDYTLNAYTPGLFWSTTNDNPTKPKAGIWLREDGGGTDMYFGTSTSYATGITNTALVIDDGGRVGIGTITPSAKLHAVNDVSSATIHGQNTGAHYGVYGSSVGNYGVYGYSTGTHGILGQTAAAGGVGVYGMAQNNANMYGGLGWGNAYGVYGYTNIGATFAGYFRSQISTGHALLAHNIGWNYFCYIGHSGGFSLSCSGPTAGVSDERLKKDIVPLSEEEGLDSIMKVTPVHYRWKDKRKNKDNHKEIGFLAQNIETVYPELVGTIENMEPPSDDKDKPKGLKHTKVLQYERLAAPLVKSIQQLNQKSIAQQNQIDALIKEINALKKAK